MTGKHTRAAELWAKIEATLDHRFTISDAERAAFIRAVGEVITGRALQPRKSRATVPEPKPMQILAPVRTATIGRVRTRLHEMPPDDVIARRLDQFLDRACAMRGYSGDDKVEYEKH